jgi:hypothetical protein
VQPAETGLEVDLIEAPESKKLVDLLFPSLKKVLQRLSKTERAKDAFNRALRVLKSLQISARVDDTDFTFGLQPEPGFADSGDLERDLPDLIQAVGEVAKESKKGFLLLIDELQYLTAQRPRSTNRLAAPDGTKRFADSLYRSRSANASWLVWKCKIIL